MTDSQPDGPLFLALQRALSAVTSTTADAAALQLAASYAQLIDRGGDAAKLGPPLLAVLEALGMTPRARAALTGKGAPGATARSALDELRAKRAARIDGATTLDATAT